MSEAVTISATWRDFLEMCKPRVVLLMLLSYLILAGELYFRYWYEQTDSFSMTLTSNRWLLK